MLLMGQGAGAGNILARFRALFCKVRGDGRPNGGNGGQNWMEDRSEQGMPNVGNYSRRAWGQKLSSALNITSVALGRDIGITTE